MNPKNRRGLPITDSGFLALIVLDQFNFSPLKQDLSKDRCIVGSNHKQRFFDMRRYLMSLRTLLESMKPKTAVKSYSQITTVFGT
jgi:hypothetical protein